MTLISSLWWKIRHILVMFKVFATPFLPTISAMAVSVRQTLCGVATLRTAIHLLLTYLLTYSADSVKLVMEARSTRLA